MARNIIFLVIYVILLGISSAETLLYLLIVQCGMAMIVDLRHKRINITPIFIFNFSVIIACIGNILLIEKIGKVDFKTYSYIVPKFIDPAAELWCISCCIILIGYKFIGQRSFPPVDYVIKNKETIRMMFYVLVCANVMSIYGMGINYKGGAIFKIFGLLNTVGILFFSRLWGKENNKTFGLYAVTLFILQTYIALTTSYLRTELILPTIYITVGYFIGKQDLRYVFSYRIIAPIAVIIMFSSAFSSLKNNRSNFIDAFKGEKTMSDEASEEKSNALLDRSANFAQLTSVMRLVKQKGFYKGRASAPLVAALIPRFLWKDKPQIALGSWFALEIGAAYKADNGRINNSINMTIPGELYLDFGWIGVVIGSLLIGMFIAVLWNATKFYTSQYNLIGIIFGGYLLLVGFINFGADLQIVLTIMSTYLIFLAIKKLLLFI